MGDWFSNLKKSSSNFHKLLKERMDKTNTHRKLTAEEARPLAKLEVIFEKLKRKENVQTASFKFGLVKMSTQKSIKNGKNS